MYKNIGSGTWGRICVMDVAFHRQYWSNKDEAFVPASEEYVQLTFAKYVDKHFRDDDRLWVVWLDSCNGGTIALRIFDNIDDLLEAFEGRRYEKINSVFVDQHEYIKVPDAYVDLFEKHTK